MGDIVWPEGVTLSPVAGGGTSTDNAIPRWDGTSGTLLQDSSVLIDDSDNITGVGSIDMSTTSTSVLTVPLGTAAAPSVAFGDGDTGLYEASDDNLGITIAGSLRWYFTGSGIGTANSAFPIFRYTNATATNPAFCPRESDINTGLGWAAEDQLSLVAGGVEGLRLTESTGVLLTYQANTGLTADAGSAQGGTPLTSSVNEISTCATTGDSVTLPAAAAGNRVTIINNGANACDVFPASGDNLGAGVDTAASLAAGANITYIAYDATNYVAES